MTFSSLSFQQFLCIKNIRTFLQACSRVFGLRSEDLFEPNGLFDVTDFGQVIYTLSKLSQSPLAAAQGVQAFAVNFEDQQTYDEDIYKNLEDLADEHDLANEGDIYDTVEGEEDSIYDDLVSLRKQKSQFQPPQFPLQSNLAEPEQPKKDKRQYCIEEIVETEKKYVDALYMLINGFKNQLVHTIPPKVLDSIFLNLEELHRGHCEFNADLSSTQNSRPHRTRTNMTISEVFLKHHKIFLQYGYYCSNLMSAQEAVDEVLKDSTARQTIETCEYHANNSKFKLRDLLSVPMQRCMKYHLLLRELIKYTDKTHAEKKELEKALEIMQDICLYVNEVKRDNEIMQTIRDIRKSMVNYQGGNLNQYGRLQNDGELKVKMPANTKKGVMTSTQKYCFLFDKVIIVCNKGGKLGMEKFWGQESHEYSQTIELKKYKVENNLPKGKSGKWNWCFCLTPYKNNNNEQREPNFELYCKTQDQMDKWVDSITLAKDNIVPMPNSEHKYEYVSFKDPTYCQECQKLLRGQFFQGYKCQVCNINVHKECLNKETVQHCQQRQGSQVVKAIKKYQGIPRPPPGANPLVFEWNELIEILNKEDPKWWKGRSTQTYEQGFFPAEHVVPQRQSQAAGHLRPNYEVTVPTGISSHRSPHHDKRSSSPNPGTILDSQWYVGKMDRVTAIDQLKEKPDSCYLVRDSVKESEHQTHAISIKHEQQVKHIKVLYYLGKFGLVDKDSCDFNTLPDLIMHYSKNSLRDVFNGLHSTLKIPLRESSTVQAASQVPVPVQGKAVAKPEHNGPSGRENPKPKRYTVIGTARALFPFTARESGELPLQKGDRVDIISKAGQNRGWWKGAVGGRIGYFPYTYVEEDENAALP
ncbi:proto-oncogene vav-like isoform X2 [Patiria miniata]|uniref:Uncharacterized protein n=1 Tax=Patiria miniata TaxID=46514 RepID=A0A913Z737_PATMI|nr:proto-oncogene vav-like isoform X2 [Patiria miniata]